jgi:hypothetical protein
MAIDRRHLGHAFPTFQVLIEGERLRRFDEAIGETNASFAPDVAPPTFLKCIEGEHDSSRAILDALEVDLKRVLHAKQEFDYFAPIRAGDCITVDRRVSDIYEKRGGAMEFIVIESVFRNEAGSTVARSRQVVLVRNPVTEGI